MRKFKIEIRNNCKICQKPIEKHSRFRTYCSKQCRQKAINRRQYEYQKKWQQEKRGQYAPDKKRCIICKKWYYQVGSHIWQKHGLTAREYREEFDLPIKKGILPDWLRKLKGEQAIENKTFENLKIGKKFWYKKGDKRAKIISGWKGRRGSKGYQTDEYY